MKVVIAHGGNIGFQGGGTLRVLTFARALAKSGYDVSLVVPEPVGSVPEDIKDFTKIYTIPVRSKGLLDQVIRASLVTLKAKKLAKREKAMLQIEHSTLGGVASLLGCSNYVLDVHDLEFDDDLYKGIPLASGLIYHLEKKSIEKALKIIVVSEQMKEFISREWNVEEDKVEVIPNGVRDEVLKYEVKEEEEGLISFLGVLKHNIDYDKIIRLAKELEEVKRVYVIGDGPMRSKFLRRVKKERISNVIVPGYLPDKEAYDILARSEVCILPLKNTFHTKVAMHLKVLEYAALGKAIATDRDATAVIFERHKAALVSNPANADEFVENVHRLLKDSALRKELGRNARNLVMNFTWENAGKKLVKVYEEME
jgi:glycosyltransferase involved in cell wall biosynthesis